jgi:FKBP-type peptidyl-prolyl cis-trans isomerase 2
MALTDGQVVTLEYTVSFEDGTALDSTGECGPIAIMYGSGQLFPALEDRIAHVAIGETTTFSMPAEDAFGEWRPDLVKRIGRDRLPRGLDLEIGAEYRLKDPDGRGVRFRLVEIVDDELVADFNAPHAGKRLRATVTLIAVRDPTPDEERRGRV